MVMDVLVIIHVNSLLEKIIAIKIVKVILVYGITIVVLEELVNMQMIHI